MVDLSIDLDPSSASFDRDPTRSIHRPGNFVENPIEPDRSSFELDPKPTNLDRNPTNLDRNPTNLDQKPTNLDQKPTRFDQRSGNSIGSPRDVEPTSRSPIWGLLAPVRSSGKPETRSRAPDRSLRKPPQRTSNKKTTSRENNHPHFSPFSRCRRQEGTTPSHNRRGTPLQKAEVRITLPQNDGTGTATAIPAGTTVEKINIAAQRAKVEAKFTALVNGVNTYVSSTTLDLGDQSIPKAQVVSRLQARINAAEATKAARLALHTAVAAEALIVADTTPLVVDLKAYFQAKFGKTNPKMQSVGFTQAKVRQVSAATKATSAAKAKATRDAVGPTGKKQRKAAAAAITANAAAPAPATTPAPAAPAPVTTAPVATSGK